MPSGTIKDPDPPQAMAKGFKIHKHDYVDILKIGVLLCDDCSSLAGNPIEHIYLDNMGGSFRHGDTVDFDHAEFKSYDAESKLAINLK